MHRKALGRGLEALIPAVSTITRSTPTVRRKVTASPSTALVVTTPHGTAYDVAWQGVAKHTMLARAITMAAALAGSLGIAPGARVLALFPGSREQEVGSHWETFRAVADARAAQKFNHLRGLLIGGKEDAAKIFARSCAPCHGKEGEPNAVFAKQGVRNFKDAAWQKATTDAQIEKTIHEGKKGTMMASFEKQLSAEEIKGLAAYIRTLGPDGLFRAPALIDEISEPFGNSVHQTRSS